MESRSSTEQQPNSVQHQSLTCSKESEAGTTVSNKDSSLQVATQVSDCQIAWYHWLVGRHWPRHAHSVRLSPIRCLLNKPCPFQLYSQSVWDVAKFLVTTMLWKRLVRSVLCVVWSFRLVDIFCRFCCCAAIQHRRFMHPMMLCCKKWVYKEDIQIHYNDTVGHPKCGVCCKGFSTMKALNEVCLRCYFVRFSWTWWLLICKHECEGHPFHCKICNLSFASETSNRHPTCKTCNLCFGDVVSYQEVSTIYDCALDLVWP